MAHGRWFTAVAFLLCAAAAATASATSYTSVQSGNWSATTTWSPAGVPGAADSATVQSGHTVTLDVPVTVASLTESGNITGANSLTVTSSFTWSGGTQSGTGTTTLPNTCTTNVNAGGFLDARTLSVAGAFNVNGAFIVYMQNNAQLMNSGTIDFVSDAVLAVNGVVGTTAITNSGTIEKTGGTGMTTVTVPLTMSSGSQFLVNTASMTAGAVTSTGGTFSVSAGATLDFANNAARSFDAASQISGAGAVNWQNGTSTVAGTYNVTGTTTNSGGTTTLSDIAGIGDIAVSSGTLTLNGATSVSAGTLTMSGGTLTGTAPLTLSGVSMTWSAGTISGTGALTIPAAATVSISGGILDTRAVTNNGTMNLTSNGTWSMQNGASVINSGTVDFQSDSSIGLTTGATSLTNNGTIQKSTGSGTSLLSVPLTMNPGSQLLAQSGTLRVAGVTATGATFAINSGATLFFSVAATRTFDATSTISGAGTVNWGGGTNTVNGNYNVTGTTMTSGGTATINNITSVGALAIGGGTLTLNSAGALSVPVLTMQAGLLNGTAPINITGSTMTWSGGTLSGSGALTIPLGTTVASSGSFVLDTRPVFNAGTMTFASNTWFYMQNNATLANSGLMDFQSAGFIVNGIVGTISVTNSGTIRKSGGVTSTQFSVPLVAQSGGTFQAQSGTFLVGAVTSTGASFNAGSGTTLNFSTADTRSFDAASTIAGAGTVQWGGGTNTVNAAYNVTGTTVSSGGTTTLNNITNIGNVTVSGGGTLTLNSASALLIPILSMTGGTLNGTAPVNVAGAAMTWSGGTIGGSAQLTIPAGTTVSATNVTFDARAVANNGNLNFTAGGYLYFQNNATMANNGTLDMQGYAINVNGAVGAIAITNNGTIQKNGGPATMQLYAPLIAQSGSQFNVNFGTVYVAAVTSSSASFTAASGATLSFFTGDTRSFDAASTIAGAGTVEWAGGTNTVNAAYNVTGLTHGNGGTTAINNITSTGNVTMNNGTIALNGASPVAVPVLTMVSGTLAGTAPVNVTGPTMTWGSGSIAGTGPLTIQSGATVLVTAITLDTRQFTVASGAAVQVGNAPTNGFVYMINGAMLTNNGSIAITGNGGFYANGGATPSLVNNSTITRSTSTGLAYMTVPLTMQSPAQFAVSTGTMNVSAITSNGGSFSIASGAILALNTSTVRTFDAASAITGPGLLSVIGGTNTLSGTITAPMSMSGGTFAVNSATPQSIPTFDMSGGNLGGTGDVTITAATPNTWSAGMISGSGAFTISAASSVNVTGLANIDTRPVTNNGTIAIAGAAILHMYNTAVLTNNGTIDVQADGAIQISTGTPVINNNALLQKSGGTGISNFNVRVVNANGGTVLAGSGTMKLTSGTAAGGQYTATTGTIDFSGTTSVQALTPLNGPGTVSNDGTLTFTAAGSLHLQNNVTFLNTGSVALNATTIDQAPVGGLVTNRGTITSAGASALTAATDNQTGGTIEVDGGTLAVTGSSFTNSAGTIYFPIAGATAFGTINVAGTFTRAGTLKARALSPYNPPLGTTFTIFTFGSAAGAFATNDVTFPGGWLVPYYTATTGYLKASAKKPTAVTVVSTQTPALIGTAVTFHFTVSDSANLGGVPSGNVTVSSGVAGEQCTAAVDATGAGNCAITFNAVGARTMTANYAGSTTFDVSNGTTPQQITGNTTTTIGGVSNPTPVTGESVTINFSVTPNSPAAGTPTGNVTVSDGIANCSGALDASGNGSCVLSWMTIGPRTLNASYAGDSNYNASTTSSGTSVTVGKANTIASISGQSASETFAGQTFTVSFSTVAGAPGSGIPTGTVTVTDGVDSCNGALDAAGNGSCDLALTTAGSRTLTATYAGDANYNASPASNGVSHTVDCTFTLNPTSAAAPAAGMGGTFNVTALNAGCAWTALSDSAWITTSSTGTGDGTASFSVAASPLTTPRTGHITIGNASFTVTQSGVQPSNLVATATSTTSVSLTWTSDPVDHFEIWRNGALLTTSATTSFTDTVTADQAYAYKVRAVDTAANASAFSNVDVATAIVFTDDPLVAGTTAIKAVHITELRNAVNAVRAVASLPAAAWTDDPLVAGSTAVKAVHINELRNALDAARSALGQPSLVYSTVATDSFIAAADVQQLRDAVK